MVAICDRNRNNVSIMEIESKVEMISECGCWIWLRAVEGDGYGVIKRNGKQRMVHRMSWELHNNSLIPKGLLVLHYCDTPSCVNPHHLFLGTHKDNMQDMIKKHRQFLTVGGYNKNAKLTAEDVYEIRKSKSNQYHLAKIYNVNQSVISRILNSKTWKHIL